VFGIYRYGLAFCVAISHLWSGMIGGPAAYAVWGFYCLSGYLMTLVLNEKYGFSPRGIGRFAVNRALRIYPAYYVVCFGMFLLFFLKPGTAERFLPNLHMPQTLQGWLYSLVLMTPPDNNELLHGSSALRVELWFYVAMALGLARNRWITAAWFTSSAAYSAYLLWTSTPFIERYVFIPSCSMAFSTGSLFYHLRNHLPVIKTPWAAVSAASIWWLHVWLTQYIPGGPWVFGLYSSLLVSAFCMMTLMRLDPKTLPPWMASADRFFGNLSYPMYLCHWSVAIVVIGLFDGKSRADVFVFLVGFPFVNLLSYLLYAHVEHPLQSWKLPSLARSRPQPALAASASTRVDAPSSPVPLSRFQPHTRSSATNKN
jgi:peptidoglycan/LPS O-acetylase OafA/YrhL